VQKSNRNSIYLFVNGRLIRDKVLLHAISSAYYNLIPPGCYPFALLFLDCDCEEVDVNVHPSKTEVRFRHSGIVHDFVRDALRMMLTERRPVSGVPLRNSPVAGLNETAPQRAAGLPYSEFSQRMEVADYPLSASPGAEGVALDDLPSFVLHSQPGPAPRFDFGNEGLDMRLPTQSPPVSGVDRSRIPVPETHGPLPAGAWALESESMAALVDLRPIGQIHDSFIVAAGRDGLWIIDQHVAHERILFEKILRERGTGRVEMQHLLIPIVLELTPAQQAEYARIAGELNSTGFETEPFGNRTIAVKAAPAGISPSDIEKVIAEVLEISESELRKQSIEDLRRGIAASVACRAAVKVNMRLDQSKMEWLLAALARTEYPMTCPHGRPIALRYSTRDILRSFHRI
jgi:DNA mismatch repair protein MutL